MSGDRYAVFPSQMAKKTFKDKGKAAVAGLNLLKKKADAIKNRLNQKLKLVEELKIKVNLAVESAIFSHLEATMATGGTEINDKVIQSVPEKAATVTLRSEFNFSGVKIPSIKRLDVVNIQDSKEMIGIARGGQQIEKCRKRFTETLDLIFELANVQTHVKILDTALQLTARRVNALDFVIVPRIRNTVDYIEAELDEGEREDQTRTKKVKGMREAAAAEEAKAASEHADAMEAALFAARQAGKDVQRTNIYGKVDNQEDDMVGMLLQSEEKQEL